MYKAMTVTKSTSDAQGGPPASVRRMGDDGARRRAGRWAPASRGRRGNGPARGGPPPPARAGASVPGSPPPNAEGVRAGSHQPLSTNRHPHAGTPGLQPRPNPCRAATDPPQCTSADKPSTLPRCSQLHHPRCRHSGRRSLLRPAPDCCSARDAPHAVGLRYNGCPHPPPAPFPPLQSPDDR